MNGLLEDERLWMCPDRKWHRAHQVNGTQAWSECDRWLLAWYQVEADDVRFAPYPVIFGFLVPTSDRCERCV